MSLSYEDLMRPEHNTEIGLKKILQTDTFTVLNFEP